MDQSIIQLGQDPGESKLRRDNPEGIRPDSGRGREALRQAAGGADARRSSWVRRLAARGQLEPPEQGSLPRASSTRSVRRGSCGWPRTRGPGTFRTTRVRRGGSTTRAARRSCSRRRKARVDEARETPPPLPPASHRATTEIRRLQGGGSVSVCLKSRALGLQELRLTFPPPCARRVAVEVCARRGGRGVEFPGLREDETSAQRPRERGRG